MSAQTSNEAELLDLLLQTPVADRARVLGDPPNAGARLASLIDHASRIALADASRADAATDVLVNLADRVGSQLDRARARRARARTLSYAGRFREALAVCSEGQRLANEAGDSIESARAQLASMHALGELGLLDEAIATGEGAREAFLAAGEPALAARADLNIGTAHQRRDDPATALRCFERARAALVNEPMVLGPLDNNRGEALFALNDFAGAETAFASALAAFKNGGASMAAAIAESNLADVATRQGRLQKAMFHFEQARRSLEGGSSPAHLARLLAEQAEVTAMMGLVEESLADYDRALTALDQLGLALEAARARTGMGTALLRMGRTAAAETALAAAAKAFQELGHETARARVDLRRAEIAALNGRLADGRAMAFGALAALHDRPVDEAAARLVMAQLEMSSGNRIGAEAELTAAERLASNAGVGPLLAEVWRRRAALRCGDRRFDEAIADLTAATDELDRIRGSLLAERFRAAFHGCGAGAFEDLVIARLERGAAGDVDAAFAVCERAKSRTLQEMLHGDMQRAPTEEPAIATEGTDAALLRSLESARSELNALYSVLADEQRSSPAAHERWRQRVRACEHAVAECESRLATTAGIGALGAMFASTVNAEEARALVDQRQALVEYFVAGDEILAFVVQRRGISAHRRLGSAVKTAQLLQSLQFQVSRALRPGALDGSRGERLVSDAERVLAELAQQVIAPLAPLLANVEKLIVVPHGLLHALPFHALPLNGRPAVESHEISYVPSVSTLAAIGRELAEAKLLRRPLVVGVADELAPDIEQEAATVAAALGVSTDVLLMGANATVAAVSALAHEASLVHLACHGRYAPDTPMGSGLRLADRWLTVRDLMRLRLRAALVTLSGCETGLNRVRAGDELVGLTRGFFAAGARTVLSSLWRIDDATTGEFMTAFYGSLTRLDDRSRNVADALRNAQIALRRRHPHPAFWAPFVLAGRP